VVTLRIQVFWNQTTCCWASGSQSLKGSQCLHLQGQAVQEKAPCTITQCHIQDDWNPPLLNIQECECTFRVKQLRMEFFLDCLTLEAEGNRVLQNVGDHAQNNKVSHSRRPEFSSFKLTSVTVYCPSVSCFEELLHL
jgi:hypothetical protein